MIILLMSIICGGGCESANCWAQRPQPVVYEQQTTCGEIKTPHISTQCTWTYKGYNQCKSFRTCKGSIKLENTTIECQIPVVNNYLPRMKYHRNKEGVITSFTCDYSEQFPYEDNPTYAKAPPNIIPAKPAQPAQIELPEPKIELPEPKATEPKIELPEPKADTSYLKAK